MFLIRDYLTFTVEHSSAPVQNNADRGLLKRKKKLSHYASIVDSNPFGISDAVFSPITVSKKVNMPANTGNLRLHGTISGDQGLGYAVISRGRTGQQIFSVGQMVFNVARLIGVAPDTVYLDGGIRLTLLDITNGAKFDTTKIHTRSFNKETTKDKHNIFGAHSIREISDNSYVVDKNMIKRALDNPKQLMTEARLLPRYNKGVQEGFFMKNIKSGGIYEQLGLKDGDILLKINSYDLTDPEKALQAFSALRGASKIELNVIRSGEPVTLDYEIR